MTQFMQGNTKQGGDQCQQNVQQIAEIKVFDKGLKTADTDSPPYLALL